MGSRSKLVHQDHWQGHYSCQQRGWPYRPAKFQVLKRRCGKARKFRRVQRK